MKNWCTKGVLPLLVAVLALAACGRLSAQDTTTVVGTVTDSSGAVIPGVTVTLANVLNGSSYVKATDEHGTYRFLGVPTTSGYKISFEGKGFAPAEVTGITLYVGTVHTQNAKLRPAGAITNVEVTAHSTDVTLDTTDATIGNNIDVDVLNDLPIYDRLRGVSTLFTMQAGVDISQGAVTGARIDQSQTNVDGVDANDVTIGQTFFVVGGAPIDSLEQFNGTVAGMTPGVGTGSGGQYSLVTKSGTNHFHGNINWYNRTTVTTANPWFNNLNGLPRTPLIQNQFGGNIGGPIKRDKIFFFFNYSGSRIVQSSTAEPTVPLTAMRNGELNYINDSAGCTYQSRINTQANCISTESAAQVAALDPTGVGFSPNILTMIDAYPTATDLTHGDGVNTGGAPFTYADPYNETNYVGRGDYNLTSKQRIYGRYTYDDIYTVESGPQFKGVPDTEVENYPSYTYVLNHSWTLGNNKLNQFSIGLSINKPQFPNNYYPSALKSAGEYFGFTGITAPYGGPGWQGRRTSVPTLRDDFSWQKGSHSFVFGGTYKWILEQFTLVSDYYSVSAGQAGNGLSGGLTSNLRPADILSDPYNVAHGDWDAIFPTALGVIGDISANFNYNNKQQTLPPLTGSNTQYHHDELEAYFGDTWKFNNKLTFNLGLRYQYYTAPYEIHGLESVAELVGGGVEDYHQWFATRQQQIADGNYTATGLPNFEWVLGGKANHGPNFYNPPKTDFAPRLAFSYAPFSSGKTVFNGSAGIVYDRTALGTLNFLQNQVSLLFENSNSNNIYSSTPTATLQNNPRIGANYAYSSSLNPASLPLTVPYTPYIGANGTPDGLPLGATAYQFAKNMRDPYSMTFNFGVQQQLPGNFVLKLSWAERLGRRLLADVDGSQIIDAPDSTHKSNQTMVQAFAGLTKDLRAQQTNPNAPIHAEPFFEDMQAPYGAAFGYGNNTNLDAALLGQYATRGDIGDSVYLLGSYAAYYYPGLWQINLGLPWQLASNTWETNQGSSSYNGLLLTLDKNPGHGLRFEFNYTWSHSIDNTSAYANANPLYTGEEFICDYYQPRACRGDSDFDVRQTINSYFTYQLPIGRGKTFASSTPHWADEAIGGWELSGIPSYRTGTVQTSYSDAWIASADNDDPSIWTGTSKGQLTSHVNIDRSTNIVYQFSGGANGATNIYNQFQGPVGLQYGNRNIIRSPGALNFDAGLGKTFPVSEKVRVKFRADAFNVLNHPDFDGGNVGIVGNSAFGQITGTSNSPRVMQGSLRVEF